jgi:hypothetical protein
VLRDPIREKPADESVIIDKISDSHRCMGIEAGSRNSCRLSYTGLDGAACVSGLFGFWIARYLASKQALSIAKP